MENMEQQQSGSLLRVEQVSQIYFLFATKLYSINIKLCLTIDKVVQYYVPMENR